MKKKTVAKKTARPRRTTAAKPRAPTAPSAIALAEAAASHRLLQAIVRVLDEKKAEDVRVFRVAPLSSITDYMVLATATSEPHQRALRVELEKVLDAARARILGIDTSKGSGWTVIDAFEVMVHVFTHENRERYRLDLLWKDAEEVAVGGLL